MRTSERQRLDTELPTVRAHIARHLVWLEEDGNDRDRHLRDAIHANPL